MKYLLYDTKTIKTNIKRTRYNANVRSIEPDVRMFKHYTHLFRVSFCCPVISYNVYIVQSTYFKSTMPDPINWCTRRYRFISAWNWEWMISGQPPPEWLTCQQQNYYNYYYINWKQSRKDENTNVTSLRTCRDHDHDIIMLILVVFVELHSN